MTILAILILLVTAAVWSWHWVSPYWIRHDASYRILEALREEWNRVGEPPPKDPWNW